MRETLPLSGVNSCHVFMACVPTWPRGGHRVGHLPRRRLGEDPPADDEVGDEGRGEGDAPAAEVGRRRVERVALDVEVQDVGQVRGQLRQEHVVAEVLKGRGVGNSSKIIVDVVIVNLGDVRGHDGPECSGGEHGPPGRGERCRHGVLRARQDVLPLRRPDPRALAGRVEHEHGPEAIAGEKEVANINPQFDIHFKLLLEKWMLATYQRKNHKMPMPPKT